MNQGKLKIFYASQLFVDSCAGDLDRDLFVSFMTTGINDLILEGNTSFQIDTIEGLAVHIYFQGEMNITITSRWYYLLDKYLSLAITIFCKNYARDYKEP